MNNVSIIPISTANDEVSYCAVGGSKYAQGKTAGQALDALTAQFSPDESGAVVVVQNMRPDQFFTADQQQRLASLMARWQTSQVEGRLLSAVEQNELESLIEVELRASAARSAALAEPIGR